MTEEELRARIDELEKALDNFEGIEKVQKQDQIIELKAQLTGNALKAVLKQLDDAPTADLDKLNEDIKAAQDATKTRQQQVKAFDQAYGFIKKLLDIAV